MEGAYIFAAADYANPSVRAVFTPDPMGLDVTLLTLVVTTALPQWSLWSNGQLHCPLLDRGGTDNGRQTYIYVLSDPDRSPLLLQAKPVVEQDLRPVIVISKVPMRLHRAVFV